MPTHGQINLKVNMPFFDQVLAPRMALKLLLLVFLGLFAVTAAFSISNVVLNNIQQKYGEEARLRIETWQQLIQTAKQKPEEEKLRLVNNFFNQQVEFVDDNFLWGLEDYWATPLEFLSKGAGDCEDYSIAKYFTLRELGVDDKKMRITYVKALELNQAHMVLTYFETPRSIPVVLDNLIPTIKSATNRRDLLPVYSFNGTGLWLAKVRGTGKRVGGSSRLKMWEKMKARMVENKF
jgi:predicted transglutaminase-like cysteine proteinase